MARIIKQVRIWEMSRPVACEPRMAVARGLEMRMNTIAIRKPDTLRIAVDSLLISMTVL